jgi:peptidoglycan/LPS O-acetylase OafA/YrhL
VVIATLISTQAGNPDFFSRALSRLLQSRALAYLGRVSYSTYLFHIPVIYVATLILHHAGCTTDPARFAALLAAMTGAGTLIVSHFSYHWIERPAMNWAASVSGSPDPSPRLSSPPARSPLPQR